MDLSDVSNKKLIKEMKANPDELLYVAEFFSRLKTGEVTADEVLMYLELRLSNGDFDGII